MHGPYVSGLTKISHIVAMPAEELVKIFGNVRPLYVYRLSLPTSGKPYLGYGESRVEARQQAAKLAYEHLDIDPSYLRMLDDGGASAEVAYNDMRKTLPEAIIYRAEESSGVFYFAATDKQEGEICYIYDKVLKDIQIKNDYYIIGKPQIIYMPAMAENIWTQCLAEPDRLSQVCEALTRNKSYLDTIKYNRSIPKHRMAFFEKYREDSMQLLGKLEKAKIRQLLWKHGIELEEDNG